MERLIKIKQSKFFPCYSIPMRDFFTSKGIKYAVCPGGEEAVLKIVGRKRLAGSNPVYSV